MGLWGHGALGDGAAALPEHSGVQLCAASPTSWQDPPYPKGFILRNPVMTQDKGQQRRTWLDSQQDLGTCFKP